MSPISTRPSEGVSQTNEGDQISQRLEQIEQMIPNYEPLPESDKPRGDKGEKFEKERTLEEVHQELKRLPSSQKRMLLSSKVLMMYGLLFYQENDLHCRGMMNASLWEQLQRLGYSANFEFDATDIDTLECFKNSITPSTLDVVEAFLNRNSDALIHRMLHCSEHVCNKEEIFLFAETLRYYGACWFRLLPNRSKESADRLIQYLEKIYTVTKILYQSHPEEKKFRQGLAELHFSFSRLVLSRDGDMAQANKHLEIAKQLNPSQLMNARVEHAKGVNWMKKDLIEARYFFYLAVRSLWKIPENDRDPFLFASYCNDFADATLKDDWPDYKNVKSCLQKALAYAEFERGCRDLHTGKVLNPSREHPSFGFYDKNMAVYLTKHENWDKALLHIDRAIETFERHYGEAASPTEAARCEKDEIIWKMNQSVSKSAEGEYDNSETLAQTCALM